MGANAEFICEREVLDGADGKSVAVRFPPSCPVPPRPEEMNAYVYVSNNPVNRTDPQGLSPECHTNQVCYDALKQNLKLCPATGPYRGACYLACVASYSILDICEVEAAKNDTR